MRYNPGLLIGWMLFIFSLSTRAQESHEPYFILNQIRIEGIKITREQIVRREITVHEGDTLPSEKMPQITREIRSNLLNASIFNFVEVRFDTIAPTQLCLNIKVVERWYVWPYPIFEIADRNFNAWWRAKNFSRINYGINLIWFNFRGRRETLSLFTRLGYDHKISLAWNIPYLNQNRKMGLGIGISTGGTHEVAIFTDSLNNVRFFKDENKYLKTEQQAWIWLTYRPAIHTTHTLGLTWNCYHAQDTLLKINPQYGSLRVSYPSVFYQIKIDYRDYKHYPLEGWYVDFSAEKWGLPAWGENAPQNLKTETNLRYYMRIARHWYGAAGWYGSLQSGSRPPYPLLSGLGYGRYFVRGYEYYVIEGNRLTTFRLNLKYALVPQKTTRLPYIKTEKFAKVHYAFYLNAFTDAGYARAWHESVPTHFNNRLLYSAGLGLDFVTYYDKVLRVEYTVNHQGETGIYLHFIASI
ncbi:MAG: POTRA domain-containing protein [Bacteroidales bacterium]